MSLQISKITVQNLGPIARFSAELGIFNLIYGHNERGKTYLVEFLIRSLFRNVRSWNLRSISGSGKISLNGLKEEPVDFSPVSSFKLEDFWEENSPGLPSDISRLLIVKGAETEITTRAEGGVNKAVLRHYLSTRDVLDEIEDKIPKTIRSSKVDNRLIVGPKTHILIKSRDQLLEQRNKIDKLFEQINKVYSGAIRKSLESKKEEFEKKLFLLEKAKQYLAFQLHKEIEALEKENNRIDDKKLKETRNSVALYIDKLENYNKKMKEQKEAEEKGQNFEWLKSCKELYLTLSGKELQKSTPIFVVIYLIFTLLTLVFILLKASLAAVIALVGAILFGFIDRLKLQKQLDVKFENTEWEKLRAEFRNRFGEELTGLPHLEELLQKIGEHYNNARILKTQLEKDSIDLKTLEREISKSIFELFGEKSGPDNWENILQRIEKEFQDRKKAINDKSIYLAKLNVDPSDYSQEKTKIIYNEEVYKKVKEKLNQIEKKIVAEENSLNSLKQLVCQETGDDISIDWETLIQNLREKREKILNEYKQKTAEIIGKIALHNVLVNLQKDEDTKIAEGLKSKEVLEPLRTITKRYRDLKLDGEKLVVYDSINSFPLSSLSTGAQEQILLVLRIGFARKILKHDQMFLILDDAFQYSDWKRRQYLMELMIDLAKTGWQIIYFTMDDHIKALFESRGKVFGDQYKTYELQDEIVSL